MTAILIFFALHWWGSVFSQTFYLHRYAAHGMFSMNRFWEKFFHIFTIIAQGPSFLNPYGYAILHRMHHAYSDTPQDPHSPVQKTNVFSLMLHTKEIYDDYAYRRKQPDARFATTYIPSWPAMDKMTQGWMFRILAGASYVLFYLYFVPAGQWGWYFLLPVHFLMGPIHGAIVNWCGHKYGYRNFKNTGDNSMNTIPVDFITLGELFQNNHHNDGQSKNFGYGRWFEVDVAYQVMRVFSWIGIIKFTQLPEDVNVAA